jgi:hypothetical protein
MTTRGLVLVPPALVSAGLLLAGCGGSSSSSSPGGSAPQSAPATTTASAKPPASATPNPLTPEAQSAATGDIPDNQVFLTLRDAAAGYSMQYPEGWAQRGAGRDVTFQDKNNLVHVTVTTGPPPGLAAVRADLARLEASTPTFHADAPRAVTISGASAIKVVYTTESRPNAVTGKRVTLAVDRYYLAHAGKRAVVDLGTPQGVDNVDAYRQMIESFRWR